VVSQNKANILPAASSTKLTLSNVLSPTFKKQSNSLWLDLFSKLANNGKLTSDECKKHLKNNMCLYCSIGNYKLDFYFKKQIMATFRNCNALVTVFKKLSEKWRATLRTPHRLRAMLNFPV